MKGIIAVLFVCFGVMTYLRKCSIGLMAFLAFFSFPAASASGQVSCVEELACGQYPGPCSDVILTWTNGDDYDWILMDHYGVQESLEGPFKKGEKSSHVFTHWDPVWSDVPIYVWPNGSGDCGTYCYPGMAAPGPLISLESVDAGCGAYRLEWVYPVEYIVIKIYEDGIPIAELDGAATSYEASSRKGGIYELCVLSIPCGFDDENDEPFRSCITVAVQPCPVEELTCKEPNPQYSCQNAVVTWRNSDNYDSIIFLENGILYYEDTELHQKGQMEQRFFEPGSPGAYTYTVIGVIDGLRSEERSCTLELTPVTPVGPVRDLNCYADGCERFYFEWENTEVYQQIEILEEGEEIALLPGDATFFSGTRKPGWYRFDVRGFRCEQDSPTEYCTIVISPCLIFVRGDANVDWATDISDAVDILSFLFLGEPPEFFCQESADANDSGDIDISDAIYLLYFKFLGGNPPKSPFPECGADETTDDLTCESYKPCE